MSKRKRDRGGMRPRVVSKAEDDAAWEALLRQAPEGTLGVDGTVINDLALGICCYFMTGDNVGEAFTLEHGNELIVLLKVERHRIVDVEDFEKFRKRVAEIEGVTLTEEQPDLWMFHVPKALVATVARDLVPTPGGSSWGSPYESIRNVFGAQLDRIAMIAG